LLELDVDVLYPAAREDVITQASAEQIKARIICELADGSVTAEADLILHIKGVHVIPDFLANAGGVTVSYLEQVQGSYHYFWPLDEIHRQLDARVTKACHEILQMQKSKNVPVRFAAYLVAVNRVAEAVKMRGWI
jgi:glutamate dehydrogenase (NAD(P)+)